MPITDYICRQDYHMNTLVEQRIGGSHAETAYVRARQNLLDLESELSFYREESRVSLINRQAAKEKVVVSKDLAAILEEALRISRISAGAFDITMAPVTALWQQARVKGKIPEDSEIQRALKMSGYGGLRIDREGVSLSGTGSCIDLGGIGKGFAADSCVETYKRNAVASAFINIGGNVKVLGSKPDGSPWCIGLQHPDKTRSDYFGAVMCETGESVVTSGGYERYAIVEGEKYHHIIDPRTGYPSESDLKSATVLCDVSMTADALSTAFFVLGLDKTLALLEKLDGTEAILFTETDDVYITEGLRERFVLKDELTCYLAS